MNNTSTYSSFLLFIPGCAAKVVCIIFLLLLLTITNFTFPSNAYAQENAIWCDSMCNTLNASTACEDGFRPPDECLADPQQCCKIPPYGNCDVSGFCTCNQLISCVSVEVETPTPAPDCKEGWQCTVTDQNSCAAVGGQFTACNLGNGTNGSCCEPPAGQPLNPCTNTGSYCRPPNEQTTPGKCEWNEVERGAACSGNPSGTLCCESAVVSQCGSGSLSDGVCMTADACNLVGSAINTQITNCNQYNQVCCLPTTQTIDPSSDTFAVPEPVVPCLEASQRDGAGIEDPEFHSMRPYQASPCGDSTKAYYCNNNYVIAEEVFTLYDPERCTDEGGTYICEPHANTPGGEYIIGGPGGKDYQIGLSGVDYPILGNTENVRNSQTTRDDITNPRKLNEYVSWYLEGAIEKAEYGAEFPENYVSYAGPVKRLVPQDFIHFRKLEMLREAGTHANPYFVLDQDEFQGDINDPEVEIITDPSTGSPILTVDQTSAHDQIAVCAQEGTNIAIPCYPNAGSIIQFPAVGDKWRLTEWWKAKGSTPGQTFFDWTEDDVWSGATPPFPWQFTNPTFYMKAYSEWRGASCVITGNTNSLFCFNIGNLIINSCTNVSNFVCDGLMGPLDEVGSILDIGIINNLESACTNNITGQCVARVDLRNNAVSVCSNLFSVFYRFLPDAAESIVTGLITEPLCQSLLNQAIDRYPDLEVLNTVGHNIASDLYRFIPLGDPSDKNAKHQVGGLQPRGPGQTQVRITYYDIVDSPVLHYPHTLSVVQSSELLNQTHTPLECVDDPENGFSCDKVSGIGLGYETGICEFVQAKSNPGDSLTFRDANVSTHLLVEDVTTIVSQIQCQNDGEITEWMEICDGRPQPAGAIDPSTGAAYPNVCLGYPLCEAEILITIPTYPKIPYAKQIWENAVVGKTSAFRKIFPKIEPYAPVSCIANIPGESDVNYAPNDDTNLIRVETAGPNVYTGTEGKLFFPYLGSIYEYFLKGIQTALKPKGMSNQVTLAGDISGDTQIPDGFSNRCIYEPFECEEELEKFPIPRCYLEGVLHNETNWEPIDGNSEGFGGSGGCTTPEGRTFGCCTGIGCGPAQFTCSQIDLWAGNDDLEACSPCDSMVMLARAILLKLCQADPSSTRCPSQRWDEWGDYVLARYDNLTDDQYMTGVCYYNGNNNGCYPTGCSQYRWGAGVTYADAVLAYCGGGELFTVQDMNFCEDCSEEVENSGQLPLNCSQ